MAISRNDLIVGTIGGSFGLSVIGVIWTTMLNKHNTTKIDKLCKDIGTSMDELMKSEIEIDIPEHIIKEAVKKKVDMEVGSMTAKAVKEVTVQVTKELRDTVTREVNAQYDSIKDEVAREVRKQVGNIDINDIKKQVIKSAREEAESKFRSDLDDILDKYNSHIDDVRKIYSSIEKTFRDH